VRLSDRELDILAYVGRGMSNAQIASTLYLTEGTIKRHLVNIFRKLKVSSRSEAVHRAMSERWIVPGDVSKLDKRYSRKT
jgi:DNA-binding NarL/FixJ family response regulator